MASLRALYKVLALSMVLTLTLASSAFAAAGTISASANLPNPPNSDSWTLTKTFYSSSTSCTAVPPPSPTPVTLSGTDTDTTQASNTQSVKLIASNASTSGQRFFSKWTGPSGFTSTAAAICIQGFNGSSTKDYVANYVPGLSINDVTVTEGDSGTANATFTVSLSATSTQQVTVNFATANGTATQPGDYTSNSGTLTFAAGETTKSVSVAVNGDTATEANETFFVNLSNATNATISDNQGVGTITNDDYTPQANDDGSLLSPITLTEDDPNGVTTNVLSNDTGLGDTPITVQVTTPPTKGTTTVNGNNTVTYKPNANANGPDLYVYRVTDADGQTSTATVYLQITAVNDAPTVSDIPDQSTNEDTDTGDLSFTVGDVETLAALLTVSGSSSNTTLMPNANITFGGLGANRTVKVTPAPNKSGTATITVSVSDGAATTADTFVLTVNAVNDAPNIGSVTNNGPVGEGSPATITISATDVEGDTLSYAFDCNDDNTFEVGPQVGNTAQCTFNDDGTRRVNARVTDGNGGTATGFTNVTVNNVAPNAVDDTASADEAGPDVVINVLANDTDVSGDPLTITGRTQPPSGEGSVTCSATNCTFTPDANFHGTTSFTYTISDGNGGTDTATVSINVAATNDSPAADDDSYSVNEDNTLNVSAPGVLENDTDVDDLLGPVTALTAAVVNGPNHGTLTLNANGSFTYAPDANYNGSDSFTYRANDGVVNSNLATATIDVSAVNDAPSFNLPASPNQTVNEDAGAQTLSGFATNISAGPANESQNVSFDVTNDNHALFTDQPQISPSGTLTYTPAANASGTATVTVRATDDGGTANGGNDTSAPQTFTITVNAVNDAPTLTLNGDASASEGQTKTYTFTATDIDSNGFDLKSGFPECGNGAAFVSGSLSTTATGGSFDCRFPDGPASPTVRAQITDPQGAESNVATRAVTVANVAPSISLSGPATAEEGDTKTYSFAATDPGDDTHTITSACGANGTKVTGSENYNPSTMQGNFQCRFPDGPATSNVTAWASDSDGASDSDNQVVTVTVDNAAPVAQNDSYETPEDQTLSVGAPGGVLGNDQDPGANDALGVELAQEPSHGTVTLEANGSFTYTPDANYNGPDSFAYDVCDDAPEPLCDGGAVNIAVSAVNDPPTAGDDNKSTDEDVALTFPANQLTANDSPGPADEQLQNLDVTEVGDAQHGTVELDNGQITFTPAADYDGNGASFSYTVCDDGVTQGVGLDPKCAQATVNVSINPVNDAPEAHNDSYTTAEDTPLTVNAADGVLDNDVDVDGDNLTATLKTGPAHGTVVLNPNGSFTYTPDANYNGSDSFTYTVSDGVGGTDGTITVTITAVNDAPVASPDTQTILEDSGPATMNVLNNDGDGDGDTLGIVNFTQPDDGNLNCSGTSCTYTPDANYNGSDSFTYRASDGTLNSDPATVTINVSAVNDAPSFNLPANPNQTVNEDTGTQTLSGFATNISAGPANESSQAVSFTVTNDQHGLFTSAGQPDITSNGGLTYTPAPDAFGTATVSVRIEDNGGTANGGNDKSPVQTFNIAVSAVNDAPTVTLNGPNAANEGDTATYTYTVADIDSGGFTLKSGHPDCGTGGALVGAPITTPAGGSFQCRFTDGPAGTIVRVRVSDSEGADSNIATQNLTVADVAPTVTLSGPSTAIKGQTKTYRFTVTDPGADTFAFVARYPSCGRGAKLVGAPVTTPAGGSFQCEFVRGPATATVVIRVQDSDGALSKVASKKVTVT